MTSNDRTYGVGIIGCGNIAARYAAGIKRFSELNLVGCADVIPEAAQAFASANGITAYASIEELLGASEVDVVVNITPPNAHETVTLNAFDAGKHVYVEKPIAATLAGGTRMLKSAADKGLLLGSAPDTFLGSAGQTARAAIDAGLIGNPIGATAFVTHSKAERWHPDPTFLFQPGGGPVLDMGPYFITMLVNVLGSVSAVSAFSRIGTPTRKVSAPNRRVDVIEVTTPTHAAAILEFASGTACSMTLSFDIWDSNLPFIEIYGEKGTLSLPDPNRFDGDVSIKLHDDADWRVLPPVFEPSGDPEDMDVQMLRGIGVADLVGSLAGNPHRASGELAHHVLEVLEAIQTSNTASPRVEIQTRVERPEATTVPAYPASVSS